MNARERILSRIRERQGKSAEASLEELAVVRRQLQGHCRNAAPGDTWDPPARFIERARALASTLDDAVSSNDVPAVVARYLREHDLSMRAVCWRELAELGWAAAGIEVEARPARSEDLVGITSAFCAVSETGTLMTLSGPETPPSVSLLTETHIAVLSRNRIVRSMEDAWTLLRNEAAMPRAINFISGPSRTADIEQTVTLGAHGPYRVHIVVVG